MLRATIFGGVSRGNESASTPHLPLARPRENRLLQLLARSGSRRQFHSGGYSTMLRASLPARSDFSWSSRLESALGPYLGSHRASKTRKYSERNDTWNARGMARLRSFTRVSSRQWSFRGNARFRRWQAPLPSIYATINKRARFARPEAEDARAAPGAPVEFTTGMHMSHVT